MLIHLMATLILSITLISCQGPQFKIHKRKLVKVERCEEDPEKDGYYICSIFCASHLYDLNAPRRTSKTIKESPEVCNNTVGFGVKSWGEDITPTMKALKKFYSK